MRRRGHAVHALFEADPEVVRRRTGARVQRVSLEEFFIETVEGQP
jgi:hypothetical protein